MIQDDSDTGRDGAQPRSSKDKWRCNHGAECGRKLTDRRQQTVAVAEGRLDRHLLGVGAL